MAHHGQKLGEPKLSGSIIIGELIRNMELGRFEMTYTVLLPCVFTIYPTRKITRPSAACSTS